jgi:hypothetical protein
MGWQYALRLAINVTLTKALRVVILIRLEVGRMIFSFFAVK